MKYLVLLALATACGKYESSKNPALGQLLQFEPQELSSSEKEAKERICEAISSKTNRLLAMENQPLSFVVSESNCDGDFTEETTINVRVAVSPTSISFERETGGYFVFRDAETTRSGLFSSYCASEKTPFLHNGNPVWMNTNVSEACTRRANVTCVNFKLGVKTPNSENSYRVSTEDSFALEMLSTSPRYGFYTQRVQRSTLNCDSGSRTMRARLN